MTRLRNCSVRTLVLAAIVSCAACCWPCSPALAAPSLEAFSLSVAGASNGPGGGCTTFLGAAPVNAFFGGGIGLPLDGLAGCNIAGSMNDVFSLTGPLTSARSLTTTWIEGDFVGGANASSAYGDLLANGHSVHTGYTSSVSVVGSESFGRCNDIFTITSPSVVNGAAGTMRLVVTITGGLSTTTNGTSDVELNYRVGPSGIYTMFRSQANNVAQVPFYNSILGIGLAGITALPGSLTGTAQPSTFEHAIQFGTPIAFDLGLFAYALPGTGTSATTDSHFRAYISYIEVKNASGQVLPDFVLTAASGTHYGPSGVLAAGDPARHDDDRVQLSASPNPAASVTRLTFTLPKPAFAHLEIYDASGRLVRILRDGRAAASGLQNVTWDGRDERGATVAGGAYFARLRWNDESRTTRVTLAR